MSLLFCVAISLPCLHSASPSRAARDTHCLKAKTHKNKLHYIVTNLKCKECHCYYLNVLFFIWIIKLSLISNYPSIYLFIQMFKVSSLIKLS